MAFFFVCFELPKVMNDHRGQAGLIITEYQPEELQ